MEAEEQEQRQRRDERVCPPITSGYRQAFHEPMKVMVAMAAAAGVKCPSWIRAAGREGFGHRINAAAW